MRIIVVAALISLVPACDATLGCRVDAECGSGMACANGECVPHVAIESRPIDLSTRPSTDMAIETAPDGFSPDALTSGCPFNNDGVIQRAEIPAMPGLGAFFEANASGQNATVNLAKSGGEWDFSAIGSSDQKVFDGLTSASGQWWSSSFPTASYAQLVDATSGLLGVYKITDTKLSLLGLVSATSGTEQTNVAFDVPIDVLRFPLSSTSTWTQTQYLSGTYSGVYFLAQQTWTFKVDDSGKVKTPADVFDTLRLRIDFSQLYYGVTTTQITYLHLAECYGTVARIRSQDDETKSDFTTAVEYRRLGAP